MITAIASTRLLLVEPMLATNWLETSRKIPPTPLKKRGFLAPLFTANKNSAIEKGLTQIQDRGESRGDCPYKQPSDGYYA